MSLHWLTVFLIPLMLVAAARGQTPLAGTAPLMAEGFLHRNLDWPKP